MAFFDKLVGNSLQEKINDLYNKTFDYIKDEDLLFYNPGYLPINDLVKDFKHNNFISLYLLLLNNINTTDKNLLDLSCGLGGGLSIYQNFFNFKSLHGIDINTNNIKFCKNKYKDINFLLMDLNDIKLKENTFDIITEIDSMFHVNDFKNFFIKINNLLTDDGIFSFADMELKKENEHYLYNNFNKIIKQDITKNIIDSCLYIINNINNLNFSNKEKEYLFYTCQDNLNVYSVDNFKFIHYTCYKGAN